MLELEQLFKRPGAIQRHLAAPLARSRLAYLRYRADLGAKPSTLRGIAAAQLHAIRYLDLGQEGQVTPSEIADAAARWMALGPGRRNGTSPTIRSSFIAQVTGWLHFTGRLQVPSSPPSQCAELDLFSDYVRRERGWSEATVRYRRSRADELLRRFCRGKRTLADITVTMIDQVLVEDGSKDSRPQCRATVRNRADALRAFFRFAEDQGWCKRGLAASIASPRVYRDATLPAGPSSEDVRRLVATTDSELPGDLRDRAILLVLSVYGLRAGEVRGLLLEDIDWEAETLRIRRPKTGRNDVFPLSLHVGNAIARYLHEARPRTDAREVFLSCTAPGHPLARSAISGMVRRRMQRCGIACQRLGAHALRHAFAQRLLDEGFSIPEIGGCLGHRCPDATAVYTKVGLADLRDVADFDLAGLA